jgi:hypothetical protein
MPAHHLSMSSPDGTPKFKPFHRVLTIIARFPFGRTMFPILWLCPHVYAATTTAEHRKARKKWRRGLYKRTHVQRRGMKENGQNWWNTCCWMTISNWLIRVITWLHKSRLLLRPKIDKDRAVRFRVCVFIFIFVPFFCRTFLVEHTPIIKKSRSLVQLEK